MRFFSEAGSGLRRAGAALVAVGLLGAVLTAPALADNGGGNDQGSSLHLSVTSTPAAGQLGTATVTQVPASAVAVYLYWGDPQTGPQVGTCSLPGSFNASTVIDCTFTIPNAGSNNLIAVAYSATSPLHQVGQESNAVALTIVQPNQLPEVPYPVLLLPLFLGGAALFLRRRSAVRAGS